MITCPWCGTSYTAFQPKCDNCGGSLPLPAEAVDERSVDLRVPPPAPRVLPQNYVWRVFFTDGWSIGGLVFGLVGSIFTVVGCGLTAGIVTAVVGIPFAILGVVFLSLGLTGTAWRYREATATVEVMRHGDAVLGQIVNVYQNYQVQINGRHPWAIIYRYQVGGRDLEGKVSTLSRPDLGQQPGRPVYVLYSPTDPGRSTLYPHPYGYYGL